MFRLDDPNALVAGLASASDAASFVTGEVVHVDGGRIATR
tara:strand:+ start:1201 stop:1320 length:120 start_codon:yes stop_codon:yes gene_type:complete